MSVGIDKVVLDLLMHGADRGAVVRAGGKGLLVLMLDPLAVSSLGMALHEIIVTELGTEPVELKDGSVFNGRPSEQITTGTAVNKAFEHCDESPRHWLIFTLSYGLVQITGLTFTGEICERVADVCNAHRCPCSLDNRRPAPGYEIERTIQRR